MTSKKRLRTALVVLFVVTIALAGLAMISFLMQRERKAFESQIEIGMSKDEILNSVGTPYKVLQPNEHLERFGNAESRMINAETWVYHVFPKSIHRFVLTFDGKKLAKLDFQRN